MKYRGDAISRVFQKLWVKSSLQVLYETVAEKNLVKPHRLVISRIFQKLWIKSFLQVLFETVAEKKFVKFFFLNDFRHFFHCLNV